MPDAVGGSRVSSFMSFLQRLAEYKASGRLDKDMDFSVDDRIIAEAGC